MADANQIEPSNVALLSATSTEITFPEGYELVHYTLRRTTDGLLQSYRPPNRPFLFTGSLPATPTDTRNISPSLQECRDNTQDHSSSESTTPTPQQSFIIPIRGGRETITAPDTKSRTVSKTTQKRYEESGQNGYTIACGVVSPELAPPLKKYNAKGGKFHCPRCGSNFTRAKSVKDHFPGCISKYGNPQGLCYTDHESMSSESLNINGDQDEDMNDQGIKTEFVSASDIALESIESHASRCESQSTVRGSSVSFRNQEQTPWSPKWRRQSDTPNPDFVPAPTPGWEYGLGYVPGQTPVPESYASRTSTPASWHSGSTTPTPTLLQSSSRTSTPATWSRSSATPSWDPSEETEGVDDGDSMEQ